MPHNVRLGRIEQHLFAAAPRIEDFVLDLEARRRHLYIIGQTGTGKSTLLANLIAQDLSFNQGLAVLDPHGQLATDVLAHVPLHRFNHVVVFDPTDDRPLGFNVLQGATPRALCASDPRAPAPIPGRPATAEGTPRP